MIMTYENFLQQNKHTNRIMIAHILTVDFKTNTCVCMNKTRQKYKVYIPVLIADMMNDMCHINDASKLKKWSGWNQNIDYPQDYWTNQSKYVMPLS